MAVLIFIHFLGCVINADICSSTHVAVCLCLCILTLDHRSWRSHTSAEAPHWSTSVPAAQLHWHQVDHTHMNGWLQEGEKKKRKVDRMSAVSKSTDSLTSLPPASPLKILHSCSACLSFKVTVSRRVHLKGDEVPLRPTPLVLQSLVSRWAGWEVRTTRCCMSLQVRFLLEQG